MNITAIQRAKPNRKRLIGDVSMSCKAHPNQDAAQLNALAIVAHDLRGPLASISALLELIDMHGARQNPDRVSTCAQRAINIVDCLDDMLNAILQRIKNTGDPLGYQPSHIDINSVLRKAVSLNLPTAESRAVALKLDGVKPVTLWGDDRLLLHATENLISNAVKHSRVGGTVSCEVEKSDQRVVIRITNQGQGFSELDLKRAFRPFTKLSARTKMDAQSWGLGLWIVRLIVERHAGHIDANVAGPGDGTVVTLSLPA